MKKFALISVSDKTNIVEFAKEISSLNYEILATGNTAKTIKENNISCTEVADFTKFPEIFSGRVKTLQPTIFGGILMRRDNNQDLKEASENNVVPIDIVCVNLYPFPQVVKRTDIDVETKIENIDIGGPSLIRAASKNYKFVSVLTNPNQYDEFLKELKSGEVKLSTREKLAGQAFAHT
ncbi:MAG: bifunctional phosphoribosylaminoimidazolecarboxamide formyltransferase/IMP cyclohydrolase, partial [Melioribacteraceae bacterium]